MGGGVFVLEHNGAAGGEGGSDFMAGGGEDALESALRGFHFFSRLGFFKGEFHIFLKSK